MIEDPTVKICGQVQEDNLCVDKYLTLQFDYKVFYTNATQVLTRIFSALVLHSTITVTYLEEQLRSNVECTSLALDSCHEVGEVLACECPTKRRSDLLVVGLKAEQAILDFGERGEIVGGEHLALDDGEVDLDLVEPAGMDGGVHRHDGRPGFLKPRDGCLTAVRGAVIHDPEHAGGRSIRFLFHHVRNQPLKWIDAGGHVESAEHLGAAHVPSSQICPCTAAGVLVLDEHGPTGSRGQRAMAAQAGLDACLLIGRQHAIRIGQRFSSPQTLIQIENAPGFLGKRRVPGEDPGAMPPGVQGVLAEPPPDRGAADRSHQPGTDHLPLQLRQGEPGQGLTETVRQFTRERFNGDDDSGGKSVRGTRHAAVHRGPEDVARKSVCATWIQFDAAYRDVRQ